MQEHRNGCACVSVHAKLPVLGGSEYPDILEIDGDNLIVLEVNGAGQ
jgi:hypothetical protein